MRDIIVSAAELKTADDFYDAFLAAVGAPSWHGHRSPSATVRTMLTGDASAPRVLDTSKTALSTRSINASSIGVQSQPRRRPRRHYLKLLYGPARLTSVMLRPSSSVRMRPLRTVMMVRPPSTSARVAVAPSASAVRHLVAFGFHHHLGVRGFETAPDPRDAIADDADVHVPHCGPRCARA